MVLGVDFTITHLEPITVKETQIRSVEEAESRYQEWLAEIAKLAGDEFDPETRDLFGIPETYYRAIANRSFGSSTMPADKTIYIVEKLSLRLVWIDYTNHRGERGIRRVLPPQNCSLDRQWSSFHPAPPGSKDGHVWMVNAVDMENPPHILKDFAMSGIHGWYTRETIGDLRFGSVSGSLPAEKVEAWDCGREVYASLLSLYNSIRHDGDMKTATDRVVEAMKQADTNLVRHRSVFGE